MSADLDVNAFAQQALLPGIHLSAVPTESAQETPRGLGLRRFAPRHLRYGIERGASIVSSEYLKNTI